MFNTQASPLGLTLKRHPWVYPKGPGLLEKMGATALDARDKPEHNGMSFASGY